MLPEVHPKIFLEICPGMSPLPENYILDIFQKFLLVFLCKCLQNIFLWKFLEVSPEIFSLKLLNKKKISTGKSSRFFLKILLKVSLRILLEVHRKFFQIFSWIFLPKFLRILTGFLRVILPEVQSICFQILFREFI